MLSSLYIKNLAIIDELNISFNDAAISSIIKLQADNVVFRDSTDTDEFLTVNSSLISFEFNIIGNSKNMFFSLKST